MYALTYLETLEKRNFYQAFLKFLTDNEEEEQQPTP